MEGWVPQTQRPERPRSLRGDESTTPGSSQTQRPVRWWCCWSLSHPGLLSAPLGLQLVLRSRFFSRLYNPWSKEWDKGHVIGGVLMLACLYLPIVRYI